MISSICHTESHTYEDDQYITSHGLDADTTMAMPTEGEDKGLTVAGRIGTCQKGLCEGSYLTMTRRRKKDLWKWEKAAAGKCRPSESNILTFGCVFEMIKKRHKKTPRYAALPRNEREPVIFVSFAFPSLFSMSFVILALEIRAHLPISPLSISSFSRKS
jgi:hypothetical protein